MKPVRPQFQVHGKYFYFLFGCLQHHQWQKMIYFKENRAEQVMLFVAIYCKRVNKVYDACHSPKIVTGLISSQFHIAIIIYIAQP